MKRNLITSCDSYKLTHWLQYPKNITKLYSYGEPRKGGKYQKICFFGLQYIIEENFLQKITNELIEEAQETCINTFGTSKYFNKEAWEKVRDLGYLPIRIKAVPEGSVLDENNVCFTLESTEAWFATSIGGLETLLLNVWYPCTVSSRSLSLKSNIKPYFEKTSDVTEFVLPHAVLDFGFRGSTSYESAAIGGAAHLLHFQGSDNEAANKLIKDYYGYKGRLKSVYATEHSTATSFGKDKELDYLLTQLTSVEDDRIISIVIDSYDADNFIQNVVGNSEAVKLIKQRKGRTVFRNDSGIILRNMLKHSDMLSSIFGVDFNLKGYKIIGNNVGLLQADGMTEETIPELYKDYTNTGWAADNFITGSGGGLLQKGIDRDTSRWAFKASYMEKGIATKATPAECVNIKKDPKTDPTKASKSGRLKLHPSTNKFHTISSSEMPTHQFNSYLDAMEVVLENGVFHKENFNNILERANKGV